MSLFALVDVSSHQAEQALARDIANQKPLDPFRGKELALSFGVALTVSRLGTLLQMKTADLARVTGSGAETAVTVQEKPAATTVAGTAQEGQLAASTIQIPATPTPVATTAPATSTSGETTQARTSASGAIRRRRM